MQIPTREEYEKEIGRLKSVISNLQKDYDYLYFQHIIDPRNTLLTTDTKYGNPMCKGGGDSCWNSIRYNENQWKNIQPVLSNKIENAKNALWQYQKNVAQAEQDAQVQAIKEAIAEQVKIEQEKIRQLQQEQIEMQNEMVLEQTTATIEQTTFTNENIQVNEMPKQETAPEIKVGSLLPLAIVAGVLLL